jgi:serine/threonine-protein kinase
MTEPLPDRTCPRCGNVNPGGGLVDREYRCGSCGLELAHLDMAANGAVRGVFGWLLQPGDVIADRYRIGSVLGKGGFGVTYLVEDLRVHGKKRALKEIPELLFDEHETRLLGRLQHPAIPDITDRLSADGMVYLVLEFGGSRTLRTEQERLGGRIPVAVLLPWAEQICDALTYLHAQQPPVVHRDLKPENVLLDDNNRVMLIDFGIAKESSPETVTRTLGRAVTHGFSPPEQVLGTGTDARSDVYALGAILYSTLTGQVPTPAHERVVGKILEPASHFAPEIPPLLDKVILQALELNINLRQQSIEELARVLGLVRSGGESARTVLVTGAEGLAGQGATAGEVRLASVQLSTHGLSTRASERAAVSIAQPSPPPAKPRRKRRGGAAVAALVLIGAAIGGGWWWQQQGAGGSGEVADTAQPAVPAAPVVQAPAEQAEAQPALAPPTVVPAPGEQGTALATPAPAHLPASPPDSVQVAIPSLPAATVATPPPGLPARPSTAGEPSSALGAGPLPAATDPAIGASPEPPSQTGALQPSLGGRGQESPATEIPPAMPRWSAADLPSIYSHEQLATVPQATPSGSLMDLFESHRNREGEDPQPPASEPAPPVAERAVDPPVAPKPKPKPTPVKQPPVQSQDGWAIIPKGARKTD